MNISLNYSQDCCQSCCNRKFINQHHLIWELNRAVVSFPTEFQLCPYSSIWNWSLCLVKRRCCWRTSGMLDDKRSVQTTSSGHQGNDTRTAAEALRGHHGHLGLDWLDRCSSVIGYSHGKCSTSAASNCSFTELHSQRASGWGSLCGLKSDHLFGQHI